MQALTSLKASAIPGELRPVAVCGRSDEFIYLTIAVPVVASLGSTISDELRRLGTTSNVVHHHRYASGIYGLQPDLESLGQRQGKLVQTDLVPKNEDTRIIDISHQPQKRIPRPGIEPGA